MYMRQVSGVVLQLRSTIVLGHLKLFTCNNTSATATGERPLKLVVENSCLNTMSVPHKDRVRILARKHLDYFFAMMGLKYLSNNLFVGGFFPALVGIMWLVVFICLGLSYCLCLLKDDFDARFRPRPLFNFFPKIFLKKPVPKNIFRPTHPKFF
jgi:hypothetical protein